MTADTKTMLDGRFALETRIGSGNYADIFRALDLTIGTHVAIKTLRPEHALDQHAVSLFENEGKAASSIAHPNVVKIHSHGVEAETHYIVMELVQGISLRRRLTLTGPLPIPEALRILHAVLRGLEAIHDAGFIHRDIKPQNILLAANGVPKIIDFGIVLPLGAPSHDVDGVALGTAAYIAPEQAAGQDLGPQADLYAAGAVLFELLTGQAPFPGSDPIAVMNRHLFEPPRDPRSLNPAISPALATIILRALAKDPAARFSSAAQMRHALDLLSPDVVEFGSGSVVLPAESRAVRTKTRSDRAAWLQDAPILATFVSAVLMIVFFIVLVLAVVSTTVSNRPSAGPTTAATAMSSMADQAQGFVESRKPTATGQPQTTFPDGWSAQASISYPREATLAVIGSRASAVAAPVNLTIYDNSLAPGWDTSLTWSATLKLADTGAPGSTAEPISYTPTAGWAGLQIRSDGSVATRSYSAIQLAIRSTRDGEPLAIYLRDTSFHDLSMPIPLARYGGYPISSNWTVYTIPLADLNASDVSLGSIVIHSWSDRAQPPIYINSIRLMKSTS